MTIPQPPPDLLKAAQSVSPSLAAWMLASWNYTPAQRREAARRRRRLQLSLPLEKR
jgi:hypothetical protein